MKKYHTPEIAEAPLETEDVITASGDDIVAAEHQNASVARQESSWNSTWN